MHLPLSQTLLAEIDQHLLTVYSAKELLAWALIGSRANGYSTESSDVDIHVVLDDTVAPAKLGLWKETISKVEWHFLGIHESTLKRAALEVNRQPMENVSLSLFAYKPFRNHDLFECLQVSIAAAEVSATSRWLARRNIEIASLGQGMVAAATVIRKLTWAPPLVERLSRKASSVGFDVVLRDVASNLSYTAGSASAPTTPSSDLPSSWSAPRHTLANLAALVSRHGHLGRDRKAVRNGFLFGPPYFLSCVYEALRTQSLNPQNYLFNKSPTEGLEEWLRDTDHLAGIRWGRKVRNQIKDYVV